MREAVANLRAGGTIPPEAGAALLARLDEGEGFASAAAATPALFAPADIAFLAAGEETGRLDQSLERLAGLQAERARARRQLLSDAAYPLLVGHLAILLLPIADLASRGRFTTGRWFLRVLALLVPIYGGAWLLRRMWRTPAGRVRLEGLLDRVPGLAQAGRLRRRATFARVLEASYEAGIPLDRGVGLAEGAAALPEAGEATAALAAGESLTAALGRTTIFEDSDLGRLSVAETAGEVGATLRAIATEDEERAALAHRLSMSALARILYLVVVGWIAVKALAVFSRAYGVLS